MTGIHELGIQISKQGSEIEIPHIARRNRGSGTDPLLQSLRDRKYGPVISDVKREIHHPDDARQRGVYL